MDATTTAASDADANSAQCRLPPTDTGSKDELVFYGQSYYAIAVSECAADLFHCILLFASCHLF